MRIGISVTTHAGQHIWENGLGQNILFLARLFRALPGVQSVILLNCGDQPTVPPQALEEATEFPLVPPRQATDLIDIAIEMGGALDVEWLAYIRAQGKKVVFMVCGHPYVAITEANVFDRPGGIGLRRDLFDEVWLLPEYKVFIPMMRMIHRCEVVIAPYIWSPVFLEKSIAAAQAKGLEFGFDPSVNRRDLGPRAAMFEPNIAVTKTSVIPLLICDEAYRRVPSAVRELKVLNSFHMVEHPTFNFLANSLDLVKAGKGLFLAREEFAPFMALNADMVVSHQWTNDQNYLYLDALYGGYPLIHNSPWIMDQGYYYPDFDIDKGAAQVIAAASHHWEDLDGYKAKARRLIASLDPLASANQRGYQALISRLWPRTASKASKPAREGGAAL
jgi:hypothetical protein